jgi:hypothetical protein
VAYKAAIAKSDADYKTAKAALRCAIGNAKDVCVEQAKVNRANAVDRRRAVQER